MKIDKRCIKATRVPKIKFKESGKRAVFLNAGKEQFAKIRADGCVIKSGKSADFLLAKKDYCDIIIELKGKDVETGVKQVERTYEFWKANGLFASKRHAALIVSAGSPPRFNTTVQGVRDRFREKYNAPLHVVTGMYEYQIGAVLSFRGPHKI